MHKLYHYVHCPFCVRVRMALGFLKINYESIVLPYDDEKTPKDLTGVKMLPIMSFPDGNTINESLDIIKTLDTGNKLKNELANDKEVETLLIEFAGPVHNLAMPYWIYTPEFTYSSREYFVKKKSAKRGPFNQLVQNREIFHQEISKSLNLFQEKIKPYYKSEIMTILDIMIASHLWGLYIVPEFQFPERMHNYLMRIKDSCNFNYHIDFWK